MVNANHARTALGVTAAGAVLLATALARGTDRRASGETFEVAVARVERIERDAGPPEVAGSNAGQR